MSMWTSKNPAGSAAGEIGLGLFLVANAFGDAHANAVANVEQRREERAAYKYACELDQAQGRAADLGRVAIRAVRHVANLEAEVRRLKTALAQRQAIIDRQRGSK